MALANTAGDEPRRHLSWILILASTGMMMGQLATVRSSGGATPMLSANDRSRWSTIRALVDHGTYQLDTVIFKAPGQRDPAWYTIDLVQHRGPDGRQHFYSSKPTLLTTLCALPYWLVHRVAGMNIADKPFYVMRLTLLLVHVLPTVGWLVLVMGFVERFGETPWSRQFVMASAAFATPLTSFAVTLNNHTPAAICIFLATIGVMTIWRAPVARPWPYVFVGGVAAMAAACELPALSFFPLVAMVLLWKSPRFVMLGFLPAALLVLAGVVGTNYLAHGTWSTPYAHRHDGRVLVDIPQFSPDWLQPGRLVPAFNYKLKEAGITVSTQSVLTARSSNFGGFQLSDPATEQKFAIQASGDALRIHEWNNWYDYEGSYWSGQMKGVDRGEPSQWVYAFHALLGHHGILSLTPIWMLSVVGVGIWLRNRDMTLRGLAAGTAILTIVCLTFYILLRPLADRNYGGVSSYFRWAIWLIPLWLVCMLPTLDAMANRPWLRRWALGLLMLSVFSAAYSSHNPWSHPWLFDYWSSLGWIKY